MSRQVIAADYENVKSMIQNMNAKVSEVEASLRALCEYTRDVLGFTVCNITKTWYE